MLLLLWILPVVLQVSWVPILRVLQALAVFGPLEVFVCEYSQYRNTLNMPSILGGCDVYLRPCVHRVDNQLLFSVPLQGTKHSQMVPRVGVRYIRWGQLEYL